MLHKTNEAQQADIVNENSRWILDVSVDDRSTDVAARTIRQRLQLVDFYLPLAANQPEVDIEYVHQLRVASRRAVAAVELYRKFLPQRARKKLCRQLKQIRRAAGNARDCDVLIQRHQATADAPQTKTLLKEVCQRRQEAQKPLCEVYASSREQQTLVVFSQRMLTKACRKKTPRFSRWAHRQLREIIEAFFAAEPEDLDDLHALHQFRLRGKDLRYAIELLAGAFPEILRVGLYPLIEQVQDRLGAINDHAVAIERFRKWRADTTQSQDEKHIKDLIRSEKELLAQTLWEFARWWTPKRSRRIQRRLHELITST